jgi:HTH-type transcriptional regulator/antitoxin HipB
MKQVLSIASQAGPLLQAARKSAKLSQTELAARLGLSQSRLSAMELNPGSINLDQLLALFSALDIELMVQSRQRPGDAPQVAEPKRPEW